VAVRGVALLALPNLIATNTGGALIAFPAVRLGYALLVLAGVWLTFIGWNAEPAAPKPVVPATSDNA
jgi:hypothetical protein